MSDFFNPSEFRTAKKTHRCSYCGEPIDNGESYQFQKGKYDGRWFESKMHPECFADLCESGEEEYTVYGQDRPVLNNATTPLAETKGQGHDH